ncbi:MAG: FKBP-type peptidyl-prolyl cis-trans isomerase [Bacteroidales bacterium]|nr:FKBP-type peptidyl-prolyl cis-trans isomerase [Bacteroidales bacterium]
MIKKCIFLIFGLIIFFACNEQEKNSFKGFSKADSGLYYKIFHNDKDTVKAKIGSVLHLDMYYKTEDTLLFNSKRMPYPLRITLTEPSYKGDFFEGLAMLNVGDSAVFITSAKDLYFKKFNATKLPDFINENTNMYFHVKLLGVKSKAEMDVIRKNEEKQLLQNYIKNNNIKVKPLKSGMYFIEKQKGHGNRPDTGDIVKTHFSITLLDNTPIFSTYKKGKEPVEFVFGRKFDVEGFRQAISMMRPGGIATVIMPSKLAYGENGRDNLIPPFTPFIYHIKLVGIKTKAQIEKEKKKKLLLKKEQAKKAKEQEQGKIQKYLEDHKIKVKPTPSGLYIATINHGKGKMAKEGCKVKVNYIGKLLDGTIFDSSFDNDDGKPFEFILGKGQVIKAWEEGISGMAEGGKAILIAPSKLCYGARGAGEKIPPYSPLVFDVELVEVSDATE